MNLISLLPKATPQKYAVVSFEKKKKKEKDDWVRVELRKTMKIGRGSSHNKRDENFDSHFLHVYVQLY